MKVLVAEDDIVECNIYRVALEARGHHVTITYDGRKCLEVYKQELENATGSRDEPFGAVVLDYKMSEVNGIEAAKEILYLNKKQRIIFASAYVKETLADSVKDMQQQVVEMIQKPFEPKVLVDLIESVVSTADTNDDDHNQIAGSDLKRIMDKALRVLGDSGLAALYFDFEGRSIVFDDAHHYSLDFFEKKSNVHLWHRCYLPYHKKNQK
jgi:CheY-like chemotaxis protein